MVKAKPVGKTGAHHKQPLKSLKQSSIQKKKNQKFKVTPGGKVNLINGSKMQNNMNTKVQKQFLKGKEATPEKSPKHQGGNKTSPHAKNVYAKKGQSPQNGNKKVIKNLVPEDADSDSDEDYNEGITIQEEISIVNEDDIDDEEESDDDVPDIFGTSLNEDSDDDDNDFDEEDSVEDAEEEKLPQNKGVKMFTGLKSKKAADGNKSTDSASLNTSGSSTENSSIMSNYDEDDDEDDDDEEDSEDKEDDDSEDDASDVASEDEEEEDEAEDEEDEEEEESGPGLKALLGTSLADDDDDEDFEGEEEDSDDEDISDEEDEDEANNSNIKTPEKKKSQKDNKQETSPSTHDKYNEKTIFVGNLPVSTKKEELIKLFKKFGPVVAVRLRGIVPIEEKMPKKVAAITKKVHPKVKSIYGYVVFKKEESAIAALALNGQLYQGNYLRVDGTTKANGSDINPKKCVFLGNLSFKTDNNVVWEHFKDCGPIESVRLIKHNKTGVGKGIGYINFQNEDSVALALKLDGTQLLNREVRVKLYTKQEPKKPKHEGKKRSLSQDSNPQAKKIKVSPETSEQNKKSHKKKGQASEDKQTNSPTKSAFQGQKVDLKKKKKPNKLEKQKKVMAAKLTAKSKKPAH